MTEQQQHRAGAHAREVQRARARRIARVDDEPSLALANDSFSCLLDLCFCHDITREWLEATLPCRASASAWMPRGIEYLREMQRSRQARLLHLLATAEPISDECLALAECARRRQENALADGE